MAFDVTTCVLEDLFVKRTCSFCNVSASSARSPVCLQRVCKRLFARTQESYDSSAKLTPPAKSVICTSSATGKRGLSGLPKSGRNIAKCSRRVNAGLCVLERYSASKGRVLSCVLKPSPVVTIVLQAAGMASRLISSPVAGRTACSVPRARRAVVQAPTANVQRATTVRVRAAAVRPQFHPELRELTSLAGLALLSMPADQKTSCCGALPIATRFQGSLHRRQDPHAGCSRVC